MNELTPEQHHILREKAQSRLGAGNMFLCMMTVCIIASVVTLLYFHQKPNLIQALVGRASIELIRQILLNSRWTQASA